MTDSGRPLRIAVVGTNIGCTLHVRALRGAGFEITALVGRDAERTRKRADHFGIPEALTSVNAAIDSDIDAIVIASPPETHHTFVLQVIASGKHVLCEKPFALDVGKVREMRDAAQEARLIGHVNHPHRWFAHHAAFRELVRGGAVGRPFHGTFMFDTFLTAGGTETLPDWWLATETGGGWLRNYNTHGIGLIRYMAGEFAAVSGIVHSDRAHGMTADDGYSIAFILGAAIGRHSPRRTGLRAAIGQRGSTSASIGYKKEPSTKRSFERAARESGYEDWNVYPADDAARTHG